MRVHSDTRNMAKWLKKAQECGEFENWDYLIYCLAQARAYAPAKHRERLSRITESFVPIANKKAHNV